MKGATDSAGGFACVALPESLTGQNLDPTFRETAQGISGELLSSSNRQ
jgi:hypothetical protein